MKNTSFTLNDAKGKEVERSVVRNLKELLPDCDVLNTPQDNDIDRFLYSLIDIVVVRDGRVLFGVECKRGLEKYQACKNLCGWDGDYNTPLNKSSLHKYKAARFPVWIININEFCHKALVAPLEVVLSSPNDSGRNVKRSGETIYNVDSSAWNIYDGDFTLAGILQDIITKEGL